MADTYVIEHKADTGEQIKTKRIDLGGGLYGLPVSIQGSISAAVTGAVTVSNFPATQPVSGTVAVSNFPATQAISGSVSVLSDTFTKGTATASSAGDNTVYTPASGKKVRLYFFGYSAGANVTGVLASLKFGANAAKDKQYLSAPGQPYARNIQAGKRYIEGGVDEALKVNLDAAQTVYVNYELEEI